MRVNFLQYIEQNEPMILNNRREYSLKGILQETPLSNLFFSDINVKVIQMTIEEADRLGIPYKIKQGTNKDKWAIRTPKEKKYQFFDKDVRVFFLQSSPGSKNYIFL